MYNASPAQRPAVDIHDKSILMVEGYYVDDIITIGDQMATHDWSGAVPVFGNWTKTFVFDDGGKEPYVAGGDLENAFWRCIVGNVCWNGKPLADAANIRDTYRQAVPEDYEMFKLWKDEIQIAKEGQWMLSNNTLPLQYTIPLTARHRRMFLTRKGYLGMGTNATRIGDKVHILLGSRVPFVLRPVLSSHASLEYLDPVPKAYELVGECYLHGIMDGEWFSGGEQIKQTIALC